MLYLLEQPCCVKTVRESFFFASTAKVYKKARINEKSKPKLQICGK